MREIKFRFWKGGNRLDNGNYAIYKGGVYCHDTGEIYFNGEIIVEQFTGFTDKNGKEIYEGDIVNEIRQGEPNRLVSIVEWCSCNPCFRLRRLNTNLSKTIGDYEYDFIKSGLLIFKVIGNIHENPELLL